MKLATLLLILLVAAIAGCWGNSEPPPGDVKTAPKPTSPLITKKKAKKEKEKARPPRIARSSLQWDAPKPKKGNLVFRNEEEMRKVWLAHQGNPEKLPKVDFKQHMVVAMFLEAGEYEMSPSVIKVRRVDGEILVYYEMTKGPIPMLNPCVVFVIKKDDAKVVFEPS